MKISNAEYTKSPAGTSDAKILSESEVQIAKNTCHHLENKSNPLERGLKIAKDALQNIPEIRNEIVDEIKTKVDSGDYQVSGEDIAEMMIRRLKADRVR